MLREGLARLAGRVDEANETSPLLCSIKREAVASDGFSKAKRYDKGKSGSVHCAADMKKTVESSTPIRGFTTKTPGIGAPLVVTTIEAIACWHCRENSRDARSGRLFGPRTR